MAEMPPDARDAPPDPALSPHAPPPSGSPADGSPPSSDDPPSPATLGADDLRALLRSHADRAGGIRALARAWAIHPSALSRMIRGKRPVGGAALDRLGVEVRRNVIVTYVEKRAGISVDGT